MLPWSSPKGVMKCLITFQQKESIDPSHDWGQIKTNIKMVLSHGYWAELFMNEWR